jgi:hypothetical protein
MRIIDPHVHMYSRTTDDYEQMRLADIEVVVEPAFWGGCDKTSPASHLDYFNHLTTFEPARAAKRNIRHYVVLGMNAKEAENTEISFAVIEGLPAFLDRTTVLGIGEIGLNNNTPNEIAVIKAQMELAKRRQDLIVIHTPHVPKLAGVKIILQLVKDLKLDPNLVCVDHNTEETMELTRKSGCWAGMTVYPTKLSPDRAVNMIAQYGTDRMLVNSSADWETSDPLSVPRVAQEMRRRGLPLEEIQKMVWDNPRRFYSHSPKFKVE